MDARHQGRPERWLALAAALAMLPAGVWAQGHEVEPGALAADAGAEAASTPGGKDPGAVLASDAGIVASDGGTEAPPSPTALLVGKRCGGCHTVGQGDRVGPDLLGVTTRRDRPWLAGFIRAPGSTIDKGDPVAAKLLEQFKGVRMPDQALTDEEMDAVLSFLDACNAAGGCKLPTGKVRPATESTPADVARGLSLFEGGLALTGGGPPCISCHSVRGVGLVGGGTLAKDLTFTFARLGDQGLSSALANTPFPLMKDIFAKQALTEPEQFAIKAYLWQASRDGTQPQPDHDFFYAGLLGLSVALGLVGLVWQGRMRGVRQNIVKRGRP